VFGVLNMLVSVASFLPIIVVGPISDLVGTTTVIFAVAIGVLAAGVASVLTRGPLLASESRPAADPRAVDPIAAALGADRPTWSDGAEVGVASKSELFVTPGTPTGLEPTNLDELGVEPPPAKVRPPASGAIEQVERTWLERAGPSEPTDRA
jgi:hypothetical protein